MRGARPLTERERRYSNPGDRDMATLIYAGIGARATPAAVLADMTVMAGWLARTGWHLSSGGADGADTAFAAGAPAGQRTIWLPWRGYNGHRGPDCRVLSAAELSACMEIAAPLHPAWERCSPAVRKLHARNVGGPAGLTGWIGRSMRSLHGANAARRLRRHRHGHPHRRGPRHPGAESGLDDAAGRVRAPGRDPPRRPFAVEQEESACRASVRQAGGSGFPAPTPDGVRRRSPGRATARGEPPMFRPDTSLDLPIGSDLLDRNRRRPPHRPRDRRGRARHPLSRPGRGLSRTRLREPLPGTGVRDGPPGRGAPGALGPGVASLPGRLEAEEGLKRLNGRGFGGAIPGLRSFGTHRHHSDP